MVRSLLLGLAVLVVAVLVVSVLVHVMFFGLLFAVAAAITFVAFRVGRRSGRSRGY